MSDNFKRVKRNMMRDIKGSPFHNAESWAHIMLQNIQYLTTVEDQKSFYDWILNPSDSREYTSPNYIPYDSESIICEQFGKMRVTNTDDEKESDALFDISQKETRNGMTSFIQVDSHVHEPTLHE